MTQLMIDCISTNVPAVLQQFGREYPVAGYVTGGYPIQWNDAQFAAFEQKIRIAQSSSLFMDDNTPSKPRVLDVERYAATPNYWPDFYESREHEDQATCYCSLSTVPAVISACQSARIPLPPRWWLAWYWGQNYPFTIAQVNTELHRLTGIVLDPNSIWAGQYETLPRYDVSAVFGEPDFATS